MKQIPKPSILIEFTRESEKTKTAVAQRDADAEHYEGKLEQWQADFTDEIATKYEKRVEQVRAEVLKELKEALDRNHPYKEDIFPTTIEEAAKFMRDKGFSDNNISAISGSLMRHGYWVALKNIEHYEED